MYESKDKMVSHPDHYQSKAGLEVIDVIEAFTEDLSGIEATDTGNIIKYACRWKQKNGIQDLEKIMWYTQHLIDHLKKKDRPEEHRFATRGEAESILNAMDDIVAKYGQVSVADVSDLRGIESSFEETKIGWKDIRTASVQRDEFGYFIVLPPTIEL